MQTQLDPKYVPLLNQLYDLRKLVLVHEGSAAADKAQVTIAMIRAKEKQLAGLGYEQPFYTAFVR